MTRSITIEDHRGSRRVDAASFPLSVGGAAADIPLPGLQAGEAAAWIGISEGELFLQAGDRGESIVCNGVRITSSQWLRPGDTMRIGIGRLRLAIRDGEPVLSIDRLPVRTLTEPPPGMTGEIPPPTAGPGSPGPLIKPIAFTPSRAPLHPSTGRPFRWRPVAVLAALAGLAALSWFLFTARIVHIRIDPVADRIVLRAGLSGWGIGGRFLIRPGTYRLTAEKAGYRRLEVPVVVGGNSPQNFHFSLEKLPGLLAIETKPAAGAEVGVDGRVVGITPLNPVELTPGDHQVRILADRYLEYSRSIRIDGEGKVQELLAVLEPAWGMIGFESIPEGAAVRLGNLEIGFTPLKAEVAAGTHRIEYRLAGYRPHADTLEVNAGEDLDLPVVRLRLEDGRLSLRSEPEGSAVRVDGEYRGATPVELHLSPGRDHRVEVSKAGHRAEQRQVRVRSGERAELTIRLTAIEGEVEIRARPSDAELLVNGEAAGRADQILKLPVVPQNIEIRKEGYETYRTTITPRPGVPQTIRIDLTVRDNRGSAALPPIFTNSQGQTLVLVDGGRFQMGAPRREPGRRANETIREVELTRAFYISTREVSNREFRQFKEDHRSGIVGNYSLDIDGHPVVRVSWEDAARYCNWLSGQESLSPAYAVAGRRVIGLRPPTTGYRLPLEAEWAWAARYHPGPRKYSWGNSLPVLPGSGNYADVSARSLVSRSLAGYEDSFPATAPVDDFPPNALGLYNMGGNVAEWIHDFYSIFPATASGLELDPLGPEEGEFHVIRGSSWMDSSVSELRLTYRDYGKDSRPDLGFRIARYPE